MVIQYPYYITISIDHYELSVNVSGVDSYKAEIALVIIKNVLGAFYSLVFFYTSCFLLSHVSESSIHLYSFTHLVFYSPMYQSPRCTCILLHILFLTLPCIRVLAYEDAGEFKSLKKQLRVFGDE